MAKEYVNDLLAKIEIQNKQIAMLEDLCDKHYDTIEALQNKIKSLEETAFETAERKKALDLIKKKLSYQAIDCFTPEEKLFLMRVVWEVKY